MGARAEADRYCVSALERGIRILGLFEQQATEISAAAVARELELPRATAFRLLRTLERLGCLERAEDGAYRIGPWAAGRASEARASHAAVVRAARSALDRLRDRTACLARLVVREGRDALAVLDAECAGASAPGAGRETRQPAYADVLGRLLLCEATDAELAGLYPELVLPNVGIAPPRTLAELKRLLHEDLARGYTVVGSRVDPGVCGIAAPVRAPDGEYVAAVGVTVDRAALQQWALHDWLVQEVLAAAAEIAHGLDRRRRPGRGASAAGAVLSQAGAALMRPALP